MMAIPLNNQSGQTTAGNPTTVEVFVNNVSKGKTTLNIDGTWRLNVTGLGQGKHVFTAKVLETSLTSQSWTVGSYRFASGSENFDTIQAGDTKFSKNVPKYFASGLTLTVTYSAALQTETGFWAGIGGAPGKRLMINAQDNVVFKLPGLSKRVSFDVWINDGRYTNTVTFKNAAGGVLHTKPLLSTGGQWQALSYEAASNDNPIASFEIKAGFPQTAAGFVGGPNIDNIRWS